MPRTFLFASAPLPGHLDWGGYLQTAAQLTQAGNNVIWISEEPIRAAVEAVGVAFRAADSIGWRWPSPLHESGLEEHARFQRALDLMLSETPVAHATENLLAVARDFKSDVIVGEPTIGAAAIAAEKLGLPYVVCGYPALAPDRPAFVEAERAVAEEGQARLRRLFDRFGVQGRNWSSDRSPWPQSPDLHIVYWTREWYADAPEVMPQTRFVGGQVSPPIGNPPHWFDRIPPDAPPAFITLGSLFTDDPDFFVLAAHACADAGLFPIIALGRSERAPDLKQQLAPRLPRCIVVAWIDYARLFPRLTVVVHHGGMGTTHAAVVHGLPQVIVPHAADQGLQARRAEAIGIGLALRPKEATLDTLQQAIETIVRDPGFRIRARNLAAAFAAAGGVPEAARQVASLIATPRDRSSGRLKPSIRPD
ncbi:MAG TPA: glycosyltransferase [Anaerolineae bacterium]|nr:glycosyltransferase [Anaerolineae bacterium]